MTIILSFTNGPLLSWQFWKERTLRVWILTIIVTAFIAKIVKITWLSFFGYFWKNLLQIVTNREILTNFKIIITKCDKNLLQSVTGITRWDRVYYEVWQVWQSVAKCSTKGYRYYNVWHLLENETKHQSNITGKDYIHAGKYLLSVSKDNISFQLKCDVVSRW